VSFGERIGRKLGAWVVHRYGQEAVEQAVQAALWRDLKRKRTTGHVELYLSHGAGNLRSENATVDWFIVEPRDNPMPQVVSLRRAGRTVIPMYCVPYEDSP
jgi:hypothetical protein